MTHDLPPGVPALTGEFENAARARVGPLDCVLPLLQSMSSDCSYHGAWSRKILRELGHAANFPAPQEPAPPETVTNLPESLETAESLPEQLQHAPSPEQGTPITPIRQDDILVPASHSFAAINEFVHHAEVSYEELQWALLGIAACREREMSAANAEVERLKAEAARLASCLKTANTNHAAFEAKWYLATDELEAKENDLAAARGALERCENAIRSHKQRITSSTVATHAEADAALWQALAPQPEPQKQ